MPPTETGEIDMDEDDDIDGLGEDPANEEELGSDSEETTATLGEDESPETEESVPSEGDSEGDPEDIETTHTVPLKTLMAEREKRQEYQRQLTELQERYGREAPLLQQYQAALPEIQQIVAEKQRLDELTRRQEAALTRARAVIKDNGLEFDPDAESLAQSLAALKSQLDQVPNQVQNQFRAYQAQQEAQRLQAEAERQRREAQVAATSKFGTEFEALTAKLPGLRAQREAFEQLFVASGAKSSAKELLSPFLTASTQASKAAAVKRSLPKASTQGGKAAPPTSATAIKPREPFLDWVARVRRHR